MNDTPVRNVQKFKYFGQLLRKSDDKKINLILLKTISSKIAQFYRFFGCFDRDFQMTEHLKIRDGNVPTNTTTITTGKWERVL